MKSCKSIFFAILALSEEVMKLKHKVFAYVTNGERLLMLDHPEYPEVETQVPAGTQSEHESPEKAVLREAWEETGLDDL